jgi:hypothetical protein
MKAIRFKAVIGSDKTIRVPADVPLKPGEAEVLVFQKQAPETEIPGQSLQERLSRAAVELGIDDLPSDLAENHDHYAHGAPKGVDLE